MTIQVHVLALLLSQRTFCHLYFFLGRVTFSLCSNRIVSREPFFKAFLGAAIMDALSSELTSEKYSEHRKATIEKGNVSLAVSRIKGVVVQQLNLTENTLTRRVFKTTPCL